MKGANAKPRPALVGAATKTASRAFLMRRVLSGEGKDNTGYRLGELFVCLSPGDHLSELRFLSGPVVALRPLLEFEVRVAVSQRGKEVLEVFEGLFSGESGP